MSVRNAIAELISAQLEQVVENLQENGIDDLEAILLGYELAACRLRERIEHGALAPIRRLDS